MFIWVYHLKKCEKNWGSPCWLRSGRPKCKLPSKLRKIIKDTKRYGVKGMNLSAHSNILGNIVNALEGILNNPRAVNFIIMSMLSRQKLVDTIFGCVWPHGHTWANLGQMYLYDFYKIFRKCLYGYIIWKNAKKTGVTMLVKEWQTQM